MWVLMRRYSSKFVNCTTGPLDNGNGYIVIKCYLFKELGAWVLLGKSATLFRLIFDPYIFDPCIISLETKLHRSDTGESLLIESPPAGQEQSRGLLSEIMT